MLLHYERCYSRYDILARNLKETITIHLNISNSIRCTPKLSEQQPASTFCLVSEAVPGGDIWHPLRANGQCSGRQLTNARTDGKSTNFVFHRMVVERNLGISGRATDDSADGTWVKGKKKGKEACREKHDDSITGK